MINDLVTDVCFSDLDLDSRLLDAIQDVGFDKCTPFDYEEGKVKVCVNVRANP